MSLPTGTVTFLFTDIEGSTRLVQQLGDARSAEVFADHRRLLRQAVAAADGQVSDDQGESFLFVFDGARGAVQAALAAQLALAGFPWPDGAAVRVRMGVHTGEPVGSSDRYVGVDVHRVARICQAGHGGQVLLSEATRTLVEGDLQAGATLRDLGPHRLKDLQRPERLHQLVHPELRADFPPLRSLDQIPNNLPLELTSFIGREREMAEVKRLVTSTRLLTLVGAGGLGKTRLALHVAAEFVDGVPDGVWMVELASLSDAALVPQAVSSELHVREQPGRALTATLVEHLQYKHLMIILDNCEHLLDACAQLTHTLLSACPDLRILATSRQSLGVVEETVWSVPPLSAPDPARLGSREQVTAFEAVRLFIDRATAIRPDLVITAADIPLLAQVCHRLDGIPLAIELAAARVKVLSIEQIAARLQDRFRLLVGGSRTAPHRHQTLRAVMEWSYALLSEPEQTVFRRLAAFSGGCTLESAEAICAGADIEPDRVLDLMSQLVDKSLVIYTQGPDGRFHMLETIREYARENLTETGDARATRDRHRDWFQRFAEQADATASAADEGWLDRLQVEHDNLRAALDHSIEARAGEAALRLAGALRRFWLIRGYWAEGRQYLETALTVTDTNGTPRTRALAGAAILAQSQGDYGRAEVLSRERLTLQRALGDKRGIADSLNSLGIAMLERGDYRAARELLDESLAYGREVGDPQATASALINLANVAEHEGDYETAGRLCEESLELFRTIGDRRGSAFALNLLGLVASDQGDYVAARTRFEAGLAMRQELGDKRGIAGSFLQLGTIARKRGDDELARAYYRESLDIQRALGDQRGIATTVLNLGLVACRQGDLPRASELVVESLTIRAAQGNRTRIAECLEGLAMAAESSEGSARLLGAASVLREAAGTPIPLAERSDHDALIEKVRRALDPTEFQAAWEQGRAMSLDQAVAHALRRGGTSRSESPSG
jgi:predicted ATPase/class 3 adenylate cyclase